MPRLTILLDLMWYKGFLRMAQVRGQTVQEYLRSCLIDAMDWEVRGGQPISPGTNLPTVRMSLSLADHVHQRIRVAAERLGHGSLSDLVRAVVSQKVNDENEPTSGFQWWDLTRDAVSRPRLEGRPLPGQVGEHGFKEVQLDLDAPAFAAKFYGLLVWMIAGQQLLELSSPDVLGDNLAECWQNLSLMTGQWCEIRFVGPHRGYTGELPPVYTQRFTGFLSLVTSMEAGERLQVKYPQHLGDDLAEIRTSLSLLAERGIGVIVENAQPGALPPQGVFNCLD